MKFVTTLLTGAGTRLTRPLKLLGRAARHPVSFLQMLWPIGWARRTLLLLVMQTVDNSIRLRAKPRRFGRGVRLQTEQDPRRPNPTFIPVANEAAMRIADKIGGVPQSGLFEALANIPTTAHILGGAVIGADSSTGVIDERHGVFGYRNLLVCDGAAVPANVGVNPALTITALAERAMTFVEQAPGAVAAAAVTEPA
jgi:cholesterol oxidase